MLNETTAMTAPEYVLSRSMVDALEDYIEDVKSEAEPDDEFVAQKIVDAVDDILDNEELMSKGINAFLDATGFWEKYNQAWDEYHSRQRA